MTGFLLLSVVSVRSCTYNYFLFIYVVLLYATVLGLQCIFMLPAKCRSSIDSNIVNLLIELTC